MARTETEVMSTEEQIRSPMHTMLVGESQHMRDVRALVERLAPSDLTVLVTGETGTGKDIVARMLHRKSRRSGGPFIKVNCPALPDRLVESELFGYEKGAFTGASTSKPGRLELADAGTLFLDEITEVSLEAQSKLLMVLDGEPFMRIGGTHPIDIDARLVAATNAPVEEACDAGTLNRAMAFRLSEVVVHLKPLRERKGDIPLLAEHFHYNYSQEVGKAYHALDEDCLARMQEQSWDGNVRELAARVKEYVATGRKSVLLEERTPRQRGRSNGNSKDRQFIALKEATRRAVEETERALIEEVLNYTLWNRRKAAELLQISYSSLLRRIDTYELGKM